MRGYSERVEGDRGGSISVTWSVENGRLSTAAATAMATVLGARGKLAEGREREREGRDE